MKVTLNFAGIPMLYKALNMKKEFEFEFPGRTIRDLVKSLVAKFGPAMTKALLDPKGDVDVEIRVILNNGTYLMESRMDVVLNEGDLVAFKGAT